MSRDEAMREVGRRLSDWCPGRNTAFKRRQFNSLNSKGISADVHQPDNPAMDALSSQRQVPPGTQPAPATSIRERDEQLPRSSSTGLRKQSRALETRLKSRRTQT